MRRSGPPAPWIQPTLNPADVDRVVLESGPDKITLQRPDGRWMVTTDTQLDHGDEVHFADPEAVQELLIGWARGFEGRVHPTLGAPTDQQDRALGLGSTERIDLSLEGAGRTLLAVSIGRALGDDRVLRRPDGEVFRARVPLPPSVKPVAWVDGRIVPLAPDEVAVLRIEADQTVVVSRAGSAEPWRLTTPAGAVRDRSVDLILAGLLELRSRSLLAITFEFHGYDEAFPIATRIVVTTFGGGEHSVGLTPALGGTGSTYAIVGEQVHEVDGAAADLLGRAPGLLIGR